MLKAFLQTAENGNYFYLKLTNLGGKKGLIIQLILHPGHQVVNVLGRRALDGLLYIGAISPVILISTEKQQNTFLKSCIIYLHIRHEHESSTDKTIILPFGQDITYLVVDKKQERETQKYLQSDSMSTGSERRSLPPDYRLNTESIG